MTKMPIRLAFREEGPMWNAYLAKGTTMEGAKLIGSLAIGPVRNNEAIRQAFIEVMKMVLEDAIVAVTGKAPGKWTTTNAPESERSGNA